MKKILLLLGLALSGPLLSGCENFLDRNDDPNSPTATTPNYLLPSIISNGLAIQGITAFRNTAYITQYVAQRSANAGGADQYTLTTNNSNFTFNNTYFLVGGNIPPMIKLAEEEGSPYYVGVGKIMMALVLSHCTDMMGDIPYREAFRGDEILTPKYDPQEQLYQDIQTLLDEGIAEMSKPASANSRPLYSAVPVENGDILYKGDVQKWIRLAWSLKARQAQHLTKKSSYNATQVLEFASKGFTSSADDCQLQYITATGALAATTSPFGLGPGRANFNNATFAGNFLKFLNGGTYAGVIDPRLPVMATATSPGAEPGRGGGPQPTTSVSDFYSSWYARELGYQEVITYHELQFIKAEAAFLANQRSVALTAYQTGIRAHMTKIGNPLTSTNPTVSFPGITMAQVNAYLTSAAVAQTETQLASATNPSLPVTIMQQKYISMFLNPESWTDMRRYDFSRDIYPNLSYPDRANAEAAGQYPRRLPAAEREVVLNPNQVAEVGGLMQGFIIKKMWWDE